MIVKILSKQAQKINYLKIFRLNVYLRAFNFKKFFKFLTVQNYQDQNTNLFQSC